MSVVRAFGGFTSFVVHFFFFLSFFLSWLQCSATSSFRSFARHCVEISSEIVELKFILYNFMTVFQRTALEFAPWCNEWQIEIAVLNIWWSACAWVWATLTCIMPAKWVGSSLNNGASFRYSGFYQSYMYSAPFFPIRVYHSKNLFFWARIIQTGNIPATFN